MIVMIEITPDAYAEINQLIKAGKYPSIETFAEIALKNQIKLEKIRLERAPNLPLEKVSSAEIETNKLRYLKDPQTVEPLLLTGQRRAEPLWGLINRFAPAKMVLRLLSFHLAQVGTDWINYQAFIEDAVNVATWARIRIEKHEKRTPLVRGESLKIGYPFKDARSQQRFIDFYIGRFRSDNQVQGLLGDLELASFKRNDNGSISIGITSAGMKWARLHSPLIDDLLVGQESIQSPLSDQEIQYLLSHISRTRPGEYQFLDFLFKAVHDGANTPQKLSPLISRYFGARKYSAAQQNNLQTGGIARLIEMRFLRIEKDGIYTKYVPQGEFGSIEITAPNDQARAENDMNGQEIEGELR